MAIAPEAASAQSTDRSAARVAHIEQLCRILLDQQETCLQLMECAREQQESLRTGHGSNFVRASLTQAHLARRLYFLEEERLSAVESMARVLSEDLDPSNLMTLMEKLPEADAERLSVRSQELRKSAEKVVAVQRVNAQMIQTNLQVAAALTRQVVDPTSYYYGNGPQQNKLPASQLDQRI